jgi:hypothetical protein
LLSYFSINFPPSLEGWFISCPDLFKPVYAAVLYNVLRYPGENGLLEKPILKLRDNSEIDIKEIGRVNVDWIRLAQDRVRLWGLRKFSLCLYRCQLATISQLTHDGD